MTGEREVAAAARQVGLRSELRALGLDRGVTSIRRLPGGYVAGVWLVTYADGSRVVGKTVTGAPAGMFRAEAEGLTALRATGHLQTPEVLTVTDRLLLLEALAARDDSETSWEAFAYDLAALHRSTVHEVFGWPHDGYLGRVVQRNPWTADGHEFFARHRVLRYLEESLVQQELTRADRHTLERFCDRLTELIPVMPAVLTHGDLWPGNLLSKDDGRITVIDPAVSYTWDEVDLSMLWSCQRPPSSDCFFGLYQELNPSLPGWRERMPLLHVRELLSTMALIGDDDGAAQRLRRILRPFYPRLPAAITQRQAKCRRALRCVRSKRQSRKQGKVVGSASLQDHTFDDGAL